MFNPTIVRLLRYVNLCLGVSHYVQAYAHLSISLHLFSSPQDLPLLLP
jgi:hypothetical protein